MASAAVARAVQNYNRLPSTRQILRMWEDAPVAPELITTQIDEYASLVEGFVAPDASSLRHEFAYGRLLGVRGALCRLCPQAATELLPHGSVRRWHRAEVNLRDFLERNAKNEALQTTIQHVEQSWIASAESYMDALVFHMRDAEIPRQLGLLKSIDTVALHLAQREVFRQTKTLRIPLSTGQAVKLRMRLLALYIMLHSTYFESTFPVIQSYRETFRIYDPSAYPWWFVDHRLTERQLAWTYHRLKSEELAWRF